MENESTFTNKYNGQIIGQTKEADKYDAEIDRFKKEIDKYRQKLEEINNNTRYTEKQKHDQSTKETYKISNKLYRITEKYKDKVHDGRVEKMLPLIENLIGDTYNKIYEIDNAEKSIQHFAQKIRTDAKDLFIGKASDTARETVAEIGLSALYGAIDIVINRDAETGIKNAEVLTNAAEKSTRKIVDVLKDFFAKNEKTILQAVEKTGKNAILYVAKKKVYEKEKQERIAALQKQLNAEYNKYTKKINDEQVRYHLAQDDLLKDADPEITKRAEQEADQISSIMDTSINVISYLVSDFGNDLQVAKETYSSDDLSKLEVVNKTLGIAKNFQKGTGEVIESTNQYKDIFKNFDIDENNEIEDAEKEKELTESLDEIQSRRKQEKKIGETIADVISIAITGTSLILSPVMTVDLALSRITSTKLVSDFIDKKMCQKFIKLAKIPEENPNQFLLTPQKDKSAKFNQGIYFLFSNDTNFNDNSTEGKQLKEAAKAMRDIMVKTTVFICTSVLSPQIAIPFAISMAKDIRKVVNICKEMQVAQLSLKAAKETEQKEQRQSEAIKISAKEINGKNSIPLDAQIKIAVRQSEQKKQQNTIQNTKKLVQKQAEEQR